MDHISTSIGDSGFITNASEDYIIYRQSETVPPNTLEEGHFLKPKGQINYSITAPEIIYARAEDDFATLVATEGLLGG